MNESGAPDTELRLYLALVDQLQRYNTIIWQAPTALLAANVLAIDKWKGQPYLLLALGLLDATLVFSFYKMVVQQRAIVSAARLAEEDLRRSFSHYVPVFVKSRLRAPSAMIVALAGLNLTLLAFALASILWPKSVTAPPMPLAQSHHVSRQIR